jgi:DNA invertase Pin-like site-specific DNA recombinase
MTKTTAGQKIGYIRVSTIEQNTARQDVALKDMDKVFTDKLSGKDTNRPQLKACLEYLRTGDTLFVTEYARLARNTFDLLKIVQDLEAKGVVLVSIKEHLDTSTPQGKLFLTMLAGIATFERDLIKQRQLEGIAEAKKEGKYRGRKKKEKPENFEDLYSRYMRREMNKTELAKACNVSRTVLYEWLNEMETSK